jgi:Domain of unknown function (DUF4190)
MASTPPDEPQQPTPPPAPPPAPPPQPPPAPPAYGQPPSTGAGYQSGQKTNGLAIAALVLGIAGLVFYACGVASILALVFGYMSRRQIDESGGTQGGRGMAIAGIIMGWIGVALVVIFWVVIVILAVATDNNDDTMSLVRLALAA